MRRLRAECGPLPEGRSVLPRETELRKRRFLSRWSLDEAHESPNFRSLWRAALSVPRGSVARAGLLLLGRAQPKCALPAPAPPLLLPSAGKGSTLRVLSSSRWSQQWSPYFPFSRAPGGVILQDIQVRRKLLLVKSRREAWCRHSIPGMPGWGRMPC